MQSAANAISASRISTALTIPHPHSRSGKLRPVGTKRKPRRDDRRDLRGRLIVRLRAQGLRPWDNPF